MLVFYDRISIRGGDLDEEKTAHRGVSFQPKFGPLMIFHRRWFAYNNAKAIEHYQKFHDLWKDADPGITEVEDARQRLAGVKID